MTPLARPPGGDAEPRVLHVDDQHDWRGGEQQALYLAAGLLARSVPTAAVLQRDSPAVSMFERAGVPVHAIPMRGEADLIAAWRIARAARRGRFNILHSHTAHAQALVQEAAHLFRGRCKVVAHRRIEYPVGRALLGLGRVKYRVGVDAYVAISNLVKQTLVRAGVPEWRAFVVRSVTDAARFYGGGSNPELRAALGVPSDAFVIGNIAALVGHKDHRTLIEAARIVRDELPETWLIIVGEGPLRDEIVSKAHGMYMADRLVMTGFRWDVPELIRTFDVFALSSSEEGMCSTLLEAAASGCPIVATDAGGVREAVLPDQTGIVVPTHSPLALAQGILGMAQDPRRTAEMVARGLRRVQELFTPDVLTERTLEVYRRVLAGAVRPEAPVGYLDE